MNSLILRTATRFLLPLFLTFSVYLLLIGHSEPGGGFVGGLVAAAGYALYAIAYGTEFARRILWLTPEFFIALGLLIMAGSGVSSIIMGKPFLTGRWVKLGIPGVGKIELGTPLLFDMGLYLVVVGVVLTIIFSIMEEL